MASGDIFKQEFQTKEGIDQAQDQIFLTVSLGYLDSVSSSQKASKDDEISNATTGRFFLV